MKRVLLVVTLTALAPAHLSAQERPVTAASAQQRAPGALIVIDGVIVGNGFILDLAPQDLEALNVVSFEVVKQDLAVRMYGERARGGAVIIRTAHPNEAAAAAAAKTANWSVSMPTGQASMHAGEAALMIVDGVAIGYSNDVKHSLVDATNIEHVEVVRGAAATERFGAYAGKGVIMITTKKKN